MLSDIMTKIYAQIFHGASGIFLGAQDRNQALRTLSLRPSLGVRRDSSTHLIDAYGAPAVCQVFDTSSNHFLKLGEQLE